MDNWLIYGANGYTGALITEEAAKRGHKPLIAGRSLEKLRPIAERLNLECAAFDLSDAASILRDRGIKLALHTAGPFIHTAHPMLDACLEVGAHYLDITGEIPVFEHTFAQDQAARDKGITLISGVGYDIVPSDCLIKYVADQVEDPQSVEVVISGPGLSNGEIGASAGTLKTNLEMLAEGFVMRRDGVLLPVRVGAGMKSFRFPEGQRTALMVPWGDVVTAYHTTAIPNITAYMTFPTAQAWALRFGGFLLPPLLQIKALRQWAARQIERRISGPSEHLRQTGRSQLYARVTGRNGQSAEAWLDTIEAYQFTVHAALNAVECVLKSDLQGALTPALAFGADFVLAIDQTTRRDRL